MIESRMPTDVRSGDLRSSPGPTAAFKGDATIDFGDVDGAVAEHYTKQGLVFHGAKTMRSHWALSKAKLAGNGPPLGRKERSVSGVGGAREPCRQALCACAPALNRRAFESP